MNFSYVENVEYLNLPSYLNKLFFQHFIRFISRHTIFNSDGLSKFFSKIIIIENRIKVKDRSPSKGRSEGARIEE